LYCFFEYFSKKYKMKQIFIIAFLLFDSILMAQIKDFPKSWEGNWKGEMKIFSNKDIHLVPVNLSILPIDKNRWSWKLHYLAANQMPREYELIETDSKWNIDEKNGIILPQQFIGNRMVSSFSINGTLIICYYWLDEEALNMEIHAVASDGNSIQNEESPEIATHAFGSFQKAIFYK